MVQNQIMHQQIAYFQDTTTNQSFMDMHYLLRAKNIKNNKFFLVIYDPDLMGVDPRDKTLDGIWRAKVLRECMVNFWYFIREVVRIPVEGGEVGSGVRYKLHRGNLAMNYMFVHNYDQFVDLPRQHFKTVSGLCWYLWVFNFGSTNTQMMFINKKHDDSKKNLKQMKELRSALPEYLQMDALTDRDGKKIRVQNAAETLQHPSNKNVIKTLPAARTKALADGAGRGATMAIQYYDEFAFMPYNFIIYTAAAPAYSRAMQNARQNGAPYGMLITTTPGDLTTDEGVYANEMRLNATVWNDDYYDKSFEELEALRNANENSKFFYIRYTYQQLGSSSAYFTEMVKLLNKDWDKIRREVLIEWAAGSMNCPFSQADLDTIKAYCKVEPIYTLYFGKAGQYQLHIWDQLPLNSQYPPIIGVDVAGAMERDSSAITIIDSYTTKVLATLNCNYIPHHDLAQVIFELVTKYMKNAIVNIESNGGFGLSVIHLLKDSAIKKNLYYEIKDKVDTERYDGTKTIHVKRKVKRYGTVNTRDTRNLLIELLHNRVMHHKDKFIAPILHNELTTFEVKKNGKQEHAANAHDDQLFSYLMALYVWCYGENLMERFHIFKNELKTDQDADEDLFDLDDRYGGFEYIDTAMADEESVPGKLIEEQTKLIDESPGKLSYQQFYEQEAQKDQEALNKISRTADGRKAVANAYGFDIGFLEEQSKINGGADITNDILDAFYGDDTVSNDIYVGNLGNMFKNIH